MRVVIIGGGASGMMCASLLSGHTVTVIDKNEKLGKKLFITGKGRCNVTNASGIDEHLMNIVNNSKFMMSSLSIFSSSDMVDFLESHHLKTKVERGNRVFPISDKSSDVIKMFSSILHDNNVSVLLDTKVTGCEKVGEEYIVHMGEKSVVCDAVVVATGGLSYPMTGSTGDGYSIARLFHHNIISPRPALVPILLKNPPASLAGLTLKNVTATIEVDGKIFSRAGEMLFTHTGVSGPIILSLSSLVNRLNLTKASLSIDLKSALSFDTLDKRIIRDMRECGKKLMKNYLPSLVPSTLGQLVSLRLNFDNKRLCDLTSEDRHNLVGMLKNLTFDIKGLEDISLGIITSGGVDTREINPKTMESKREKNLFFIGEVLDVDCMTGGFNLQVAFSTAHACAKYLNSLKKS